MKENKTTITIRPYKLKELAGLYSVDRKTFRKWLKPFEDKIGLRAGHFYKISQVKVIFEMLGYPSDHEIVG